MISMEDEEISVAKATEAYISERKDKEFLVELMKLRLADKTEKTDVLMVLIEKYASRFQGKTTVNRLRSLLTAHPDWNDEKIIINAFPLPGFGSLFGG